MTVETSRFTRSKFYIGVASQGRLAGCYFISRGGKKWMRMKNRRCHFYQHALIATDNKAAQLEPGEYMTFETTCTACHRQCYEDSPLEFVDVDSINEVTD